MVRLFFIGFFSLLSLLVLFRAPTNLLWYLSILAGEFCWVFAVLVSLFLVWRSPGHYSLAGTVLGVATLMIFLLPIFQARRLSQRLQKELTAAFGSGAKPSASPFNPVRFVTGIGAKQAAFQTLVYDTANGLSLDFYRSASGGKRPCVVVVHGGSWAGGNSRQLPELNSALVTEGYHVAAINYRLAPAQRFPTPVEDVKSALRFLRAEGERLLVDSTAFTLLGRSAGGQIALTAAYTLHDKNINGVIAFYGPTDMVWGYENPTNPLVLDSRKVMRDYLGGSLDEVPEAYCASSATETAGRAAPPTLLLYGENDPLVSPRHGNRLAAKLDANGVKHFELYLPWATHGFDYTLNGPGGQLSTLAVKGFLKSLI